MSTPEGFVLLSLPNTTLTTRGTSESGVLNLECISVQVPEALAPVDRDVYLVLRINSLETPIDPARVIQRADSPGRRTYTFHGTATDPTELLITISLLNTSESNTLFMEDLETFESILAQYADLQTFPNPAAATTRDGKATGSGFPGGQDDLRGHLVAINEDTGEVVGQFDGAQFKVHEDPILQQKGHENDAVLIEVPEVQSGEEQDVTALEMFIRAVPPEQQDWLTKSATMVSHAISQTTNLLLTTITTASSYYVSHSTPSSHNPSRGNATPGASTPPPSRALVFLTSERTRKGLASVHAVSGQAVKVSTKTVSMVDSMIRSAMGGKPKRPRQFLPASASSSPAMLSPTPSKGGMPPQLLPRTPSPSGSSTSHLPPPPAYPGPPVDYPFPNNKPPLPPRGKSPVPPPPPPGTFTGMPENVNATPRLQLSTKDRVLLSADLILSTLDHETRRLLDVGTESIGTVVRHKYGPDAAHSSLLMAGAARNIGLVYVDMRGIGRRALLKRAGKQFIKARVSSQKGP